MRVKITDSEEHQPSIPTRCKNSKWHSMNDNICMNCGKTIIESQGAIIIKY